VCIGIATLVRRVDKPTVTVGIDGRLHRFHPYFHQIIEKTVPGLLQNKYNVSVVILLYLYWENMRFCRNHATRQTSFDTACRAWYLNFSGKMVNGSRYYRALESVSIASALSTALTFYPCQIRVHQRWQSKLQLPTARKNEWRPAGHSGQFTPCGYLSTLWYTLLE